MSYIYEQDDPDSRSQEVFNLWDFKTYSSEEEMHVRPVDNKELVAYVIIATIMLYLVLTVAH